LRLQLKSEKVGLKGFPQQVLKFKRRLKILIVNLLYLTVEFLKCSDFYLQFFYFTKIMGGLASITPLLNLPKSTTVFFTTSSKPLLFFLLNYWILKHINHKKISPKISVLENICFSYFQHTHIHPVMTSP